MRVLVSNDDGVMALGIRTLANTLVAAGHEVTVVCPDQERSATGHGLTLHHPIRAEVVESVFDPAIKAWACSGTPADCIKLAIWALLDDLPDAVVSGINHGANLGTDVLYSGTVSAAMEGTIAGIPSIALSLISSQAKDFQPAADFAVTLLAQLKHAPLQSAILLNVNIPVVPASEIRGAIVTRQGLRRYVEEFEKRLDPRGKTYYWLTGEVAQDIAQPDDGSHKPTDVEAIRDNYITVTPLHYNLTCPVNLFAVEEWMGNMKGVSGMPDRAIG
jgi:5'-nucleotidase